MYCPKAHDQWKVLPATCVSLGLVVVFFAILPFVNRINIQRRVHVSSDLSALSTTPVQTVEQTGLPGSVRVLPLGNVPATVGKPAEEAVPQVKLVTLEIPDLEVTRPDKEAKRAFVFEVSDLDFVPMPIHRIAPDYPFHLKLHGIEGRTFVEFRVDEKGRVFDIVVIETTHPEFGFSVCEAVARWRFVPGMVRGDAVTFKMRLPVTFRLVESSVRSGPISLATHE